MKVKLKYGQKPYWTFPHIRNVRKDVVKSHSIGRYATVIFSFIIVIVFVRAYRSGPTERSKWDAVISGKSDLTIIRQPGAQEGDLYGDLSLLDSETAEAVKYLRSFRKLHRPLTFFHIPKTAGTAVEHAAGSQNISWGSCLFNHKPQRKDCQYPSGEEWPKTIGWWHLPSQFFPLANANPYKDSELFAVVRDSYDRMVSEYYYICTLKVLEWRPDQCDRKRLSDKEYFNQWLQRKVKERATNSPLGYLIDNGHFTPQYEYLVGPHQVRMIDHVLRLEDVDSEFTNLMKAFGMPDVQLEKMNAFGAEKRDEKAKLSIRDLDVSTLDLLHKLYANDFEDLGYSKNLTSTS